MNQSSSREGDRQANQHQDAGSDDGEAYAETATGTTLSVNDWARAYDTTEMTALLITQPDGAYSDSVWHSGKIATGIDDYFFGTHGNHVRQTVADQPDINTTLQIAPAGVGVSITIPVAGIDYSAAAVYNWGTDKKFPFDSEWSNGLATPTLLTTDMMGVGQTQATQTVNNARGGPSWTNKRFISSDADERALKVRFTVIAAAARSNHVEHLDAKAGLVRWDKFEDVVLAIESPDDDNYDGVFRIKQPN